MNEARAADLLKKSDTHPVAVDKILTAFYPEWVDHEPETTLTLLRSFTQQTAVDPIIRTKVNALKVLHSSEGPWEDWESFEWVAQALNDNMADFSNAYRPELGELFITIETMNKLRKLPLSDEIHRWLAACCLDLGLVYVPEPLDMLNHLLARVEYRCVRCGNVDLDEDNKQCDYCDAPESSLVKQPRYIDPDRIKDAWRAIQGETPDELRLGETVKGVHLAKLAAARIAATARQQQLQQELDYVRE